MKYRYIDTLHNVHATYFYHLHEISMLVLVDLICSTFSSTIGKDNEVQLHHKFLQVTSSTYKSAGICQQRQIVCFVTSDFILMMFKINKTFVAVKNGSSFVWNNNFNGLEMYQFIDSTCSTVAWLFDTNRWIIKQRHKSNPNM